MTGVTAAAAHAVSAAAAGAPKTAEAVVGAATAAAGHLPADAAGAGAGHLPGLTAHHHAGVFGFLADGVQLKGGVNCVMGMLADGTCQAKSHWGAGG